MTITVRPGLPLLPPATTAHTPAAPPPTARRGSASRARGFPGRRGGGWGAARFCPAPPGGRPRGRSTGGGRRGPGRRSLRSPDGLRAGGLPDAAPAAAARCATGRGGGGAASRAFSLRLSRGRRGVLEPRQTLLDGV